MEEQARRFATSGPTPSRPPMPIGKLTLELSIPHAQSLKDRRQVVRSIKDKLRHAFNLSIAECNDGGPLWNQATLEIAVVSSSTQSLQQHLASIDRRAHRLAIGLSVEIADSWAELLTEQSEALDVSDAARKILPEDDQDFFTPETFA